MFLGNLEWAYDCKDFAFSDVNSQLRFCSTFYIKHVVFKSAFFALYGSVPYVLCLIL